MDPVLFEVPVPIRTPRLLLRPAQAGDGLVLNEAILESREELRPWMPWARTPTPPTPEESEENCRKSGISFLLREDLRLLMFSRENGRLVGSTGLHRFNLEGGLFEIGYWIRTSETKKGYAREATLALTRYAFGVLGAKRVHLFCNAENHASCAIPTSLGFECEGRLKNYDTYVEANRPCRDSFVFARTSTEGLPPLEMQCGV